ncbi:MAG: TlpA disulfide reductase family protein [Clostridia bacterium]|nr:TlpA disulfide reductase family protein [Clostridia bacterium]
MFRYRIHLKGVAAIVAASLLTIILASWAAAAPIGQMTGKSVGALKLKDINGKVIDTGRDPAPVVLLDFWQTTCSPCHSLAPHLQALYAKYASKGLLVVGVSLGDTVSKVRDYAKGKGLTYSMVVDYGTLANSFGVRFTPTVVIIDRGGVVRLVQEGFGDGLGIEAAIEKVVRDLLAVK